ncbi:hypothetical protein N7486_001669 [Penicillium sp. IBT 16267x]|nr:hypothetical protein N7486_001669 [Penicillium sp. IBT 16267x]
MFVLVPHRIRGRGVLAILRSYLSRRRQCQSNSTCGDATVQDTKVTENDNKEDKGNDTDLMINQLAALAAAVSRVSTNPTPASSSSLCSTDTQSICSEKDQEESFHYLRSLITISYLTPNPEITPANQTLQVPPLRRKRASSRLSLRLDIPGLSFAPKTRKSKSSPRYTTLPPAYTTKPISIRPEVRF